MNTGDGRRVRSESPHPGWAAAVPGEAAGILPGGVESELNYRGNGHTDRRVPAPGWGPKPQAGAWLSAPTVSTNARHPEACASGYKGGKQILSRVNWVGTEGRSGSGRRDVTRWPHRVDACGGTRHAS